MDGQQMTPEELAQLLQQLTGNLLGAVEHVGGEREKSQAQERENEGPTPRRCSPSLPRLHVQL